MTEAKSHIPGKRPSRTRLVMRAQEAGYLTETDGGVAVIDAGFARVRMDDAAIRDETGAEISLARAAEILKISLE